MHPAISESLLAFTSGGYFEGKQSDFRSIKLIHPIVEKLLTPVGKPAYVTSTGDVGLFSSGDDHTAQTVVLKSVFGTIRHPLRRHGSLQRVMIAKVIQSANRQKRATNWANIRIM